MRRRWSLGLSMTLAWTLLALVFTFQSYYVNVLRGQSETWFTLLSYHLANVWLWALFSMAIFKIAGRFPVDRHNWPLVAAVHVPASVLVSFVHSAAFLTVYTLVDYTPTRMYHSLAETFRDVAWFVMILRSELLTYWLIVIGSYAIGLYRSYQREKLDALQLKGQLVQAQLQALKMQLHPHFLFNTLNSISALVHRDPDAADEMICLLGDFLRMTLERPSAQEVTLEEELAFLEHYLAIERVRFQDRLSVHMGVEPETLGGRVPNLILQPIIENAVRHGIAPLSTAGRIDIRSEVAGDRLRLQVSDNGPGLPPTAGSNGVDGRGVGLANTRARLENLYGSDHRFELANAPTGGLVVTIELPLNTVTNDE